jgi:hypothetical protein
MSDEQRSHTHIFIDDFGSVDAALLDYCNTMLSDFLKVKVRRIPLTSASARYVVRYDDAEEYSFFIRQLDTERVLLRVDLTLSAVERLSAIDGQARDLIASFLVWRAHEHELPTSSPLEATTLTPYRPLPELYDARRRKRSPKPGARHGGAPTNEANDRARARIAAHDDYEQVLIDWAQEQRRDPKDPASRDAFRKAINRKPKRTDGNNL